MTRSTERRHKTYAEIRRDCGRPPEPKKSNLKVPREDIIKPLTEVVHTVIRKMRRV